MCLLLVGIGTSSIAEEEKDVGYKVKFTITYNEVDKTEVGKLIQSVINKHHEACTVKFDINKAGLNSNITTVDVGQLTMGTPTYTLEYK